MFTSELVVLVVLFQFSCQLFMHLMQIVMRRLPSALEWAVVNIGTPKR